MGLWLQETALEIPLKGKLEDTRSVQRVNRLQRAKAGLGYQVARLVRTYTITAGTTHRLVLRSVHSIAVLHVPIRMIQQIERLYLQRDALALGNGNLPRQPEIDLLRPGTVE